MKDIGIKYQLRLTTFVPVLVVAILFALFYNGQLERNIKRHIARLGEACVRQLLPAAQLALLRDDKRTLQGLIDASTINPEIQALTFYDIKGKVLAYRGSKHSLKHPFILPEFSGDYIEQRQISYARVNFIAPITIPKYNLYIKNQNKIVPSPVPADDILGWLSIDIDTQDLIIKQYQMYLVTIFITLLGLLVSLSIHYFLSKRIYLPIARLRRSMKQILRNEFETQIKTSSKGELGTIERGCIHLQKNYLNMVNEMNQYIEIATTDLQKNLEFLEEKNIELSLDKKKAEEKNQQKSAFIANMSHEIRTPMNGVLGFTNVLLETNLSTMQEDYVKTIKSSAQDLLIIINDILDFSKMDAGKLQLDCIPLDIRACVDEVLALQTPNAHKKGLDLIPITNIDVPKTVLGDPLRIKQIISNLVNNAIKFTDHGYVLIQTKIESETEKNYSLSISISDTGLGIPFEDQTNLFNAFNQADTSIARKFGGSGLGLIICKKLTEHMNGKITFVSEAHKGSTFKVYLELEKLKSYEIEKHQLHRFSNLKVICFDENPLYLEALCNILKSWGIQCIEVNLFQELEQTFKNNSQANMAFINVNQGCDQQIAHILRKQTLPCVIISKWPIADPFELGAQSFLFKPPNIQKLFDTIQGLLNKENQEDFSNPELQALRKQFYALKCKILLAEDNPVNLRLLNALLKSQLSVQENSMLDIQSAVDGQQAVNACNITRFNAILLDLQMPKLNGIEASRIIRSSSLLNKNTPIIIISAGNTSLSQEELQKEGINLFLQKPVDEGNLIKHLLNLIGQSEDLNIDWKLCVKKVSGNQTLAALFLDEFIAELQNNREQFLQLFKEKNINGLEELAHKLHGACCFSGVPKLQTAVALLESLTRQNGNYEEIQTEFLHLIECIDKVLDEYYQSYRPNKKSSTLEHLC